MRPEQLTPNDLWQEQCVTSLATSVLLYTKKQNKTKNNNMYEQLLIKKTIWFTVSSKKKINKLPLSNIVHCSKRNE